MSALLDIAHRLPITWTGKIRFLDAAIDWVFRTPIEKRLRRAVRKGRADDLGRLLDLGSWDINQPLAPSPVEHNTWAKCVHSGHTLLHLAASRGDLECARVLLARGAKADAFTSWGHTPALMAARACDLEMLVLLETHGANLERREPSVSTLYEEDYLGPTLEQVFEMRAEESYEAAKARAQAQRLEEGLEEGMAHGTPRARL